MTTLIINAHPTPDYSHTQSFFKEVMTSLENVTYIELTKKMPKLEELIGYQRIIFQFPVYWYSSPAILKQWIDNTFLSDDNRLSGVELGIVAIFGVSQAHYQAGGKESYTPSEMLRPFEMLANHLNMNYLSPLSVFQFDYQCNNQRKGLLMDYWQYIVGVKQPNFKQKGEFLIEQMKRYNIDSSIINLVENNQSEIDELNMIVGDLK